MGKEIRLMCCIQLVVGQSQQSRTPVDSAVAQSQQVWTWGFITIGQSQPVCGNQYPSRNRFGGVG